MINRSLRLFVVAAAVSMTPVSLVAQGTSCEPGDVEVRHLRFEGNETFGTAVLAAGINTEQSSLMRRLIQLRMFGWELGKRHCLDSLELARDSLRVRLFYEKAGFNRVQVATTVTLTAPKVADVRFAIVEGPPTIVETFEINGLDSVPERVAITRGLQLRQGSRLDLGLLAMTEDTISRRLRDSGYPTADVLRERQTDSTGLNAVVRLNVEPGTRARVGVIDISVRPQPNEAQQIPDATIRRLMSVKTGDLYRETQVERAKRNLILTESYAAVVVELDSNDVKPPGDSAVTIHVNLTEGPTHAVRASGGYGWIDCFRVNGEYQNTNFLHDAKRFQATARLSKIGIGRPLTGAAGFCPKAREDPYSVNLNYYGGLTFADPRTSFFGMRPSVTFFSETRSEYKAYLRTTPIGALLSAQRLAFANRRTQTFTYQLEFGRTEAQPAIFCALQNLCVAEDREPLLANRRLAVAGWALTQDWSDNIQYPTSGAVGKLELRHASAAIGSDSRVQFNKSTGDFAAYFHLGRGVVLTPRVRAGVVLGPSLTATSRFIPAQERLFGGGGNTVRGFKESELGPKVYIANGFDTVRVSGADGDIAPGDTVFFRVQPGAGAQRSVPTGGSALFVANLELRVPSPFLKKYLRYSLFADAGEVWSPGAAQAQDKFRNLKFTPGLGLQLVTPIGAIRADIAYNQYAPRTGAVYFDAPVDQGGQLYCVSPGNELAVTGLGGPTGTSPVQAPGACARDFRPPAPSGFLRRLVFTLGLGQAY